MLDLDNPQVLKGLGALVEELIAQKPKPSESAEYMDDPNSLEPETDEELIRAEAFRRLRVPRPRPQGQTLVSLQLQKIMPQTKASASEDKPDNPG
ncbi:MAG: hypothetical protein GC205_13400 [Bacteroidetes bacterium]|nr:hypothetical protein [Bacteroidota bacterium]